MNSMPYQHSIYALPQSSIKFHQEVIPCQICFVFSASRQLAIKPVWIPESAVSSPRHPICRTNWSVNWYDLPKQPSLQRNPCNRKKRQIPNFCPDTWTTENPLTVCWSMVYLQHLQMWILMINQSKITSKKCRKTRRISCAVCLQTYVAYQISHIRTSQLQIWIHQPQIWISQIQIWIHKLQIWISQIQI